MAEARITVKLTNFLSLLRQKSGKKRTRFCLETLYTSVAPGGIVIIDDYHTFASCKTAVDEFRERLNICSLLITTEPGSEVYWQKRS